jgi:hypothetical protein
MQKTRVLVRRYDSIKNYVGENKIYEAGDILYVSTKNNDMYDVILSADGRSKFTELLKEAMDESEYVYLMAKKSK